MKIKKEQISPQSWLEFLKDLLEVWVSQDAEASHVLEEIGDATFQFFFYDRPELSYWQAYTGNKIFVHLGVHPNPDITAKTDIETYLLTTAGEISIMEATADELYDISGDQEKLWATANIVPFVLRAFQDLRSRGRVPGVSDE